jgi:iodotyrosine deiodinase
MSMDPDAPAPSETDEAPRFVPLTGYVPRDDAALLARAEAFHAQLRTRRSVRHFSTRPVPRRVIELAIMTAASAPSGAHRQPWRFVAIDDPALKARLRAAVEAEEYRSYTERMPAEWRAALRPIGTNHIKPHMTDAPWLVVLFAQKYGIGPEGAPIKNYYVDESVGIAAGMFIAAIHATGLVTLPHTPSPMGFLRDTLGRGAHEKPVLLLPVGHPAEDARVPDLARLPVEAILQWNAATSDRA